MKPRSCNTSHFIWSIKEGKVKKVHNTDSHGKPSPKFKKLEDIFRSADAKDPIKFQDVCDSAEFDGDRAKAKSTNLPFADRNTRVREGYIKDDESECPDENCFEEITLAQLKKKGKTKKRKASESCILTPKPQDDSDFSEPLCKWRVKVSKSPESKGSSTTSSRTTLSVKSEPVTDIDDALPFSKDHFAVAAVEAETSQLAHSERRDVTSIVADSLICNEPLGFSASESGFETVDHEVPNRESESFPNGGKICGVNEVSLDDLDHTMSTSIVPPIGGEHMDLDNEEDEANQLQVSEFDKEENVNHPPSAESSPEVVSSVVDQNANTYNTSLGHPSLQQLPEQVNHISDVQDSDLTIDNSICVDLFQVNYAYMDEDHAEGSPTNQEFGSPSPMPKYLCLPWISHSWSSPDDGVVTTLANSPSTDEKQALASLDVDADTNNLNCDNNTVVCEDTSVHKEKLPFFPENADSEASLSDHNYQSDSTSDAPETRKQHCVEFRQHPERLPLTRKAISPASQEKLCLALSSEEISDDMDHYKCKEKLYFGEQAENKSSSNELDVEDNEPDVDPQQATRFKQKKINISPKQILKKQKNYKKGSPPIKSIPSKDCLDGPRLCRSLPRLSTGCTSIQACSENAIAFSQRQMHDIESLALKLMTELKSMKVIVEEKLLYEAYRSTSMKNEADQVKSAIKTATKTEETARKWLSMMGRDCNRFCKIMKLTEDNNASVSAADNPASESTTQENSVQKDRRKISFADEAGGTLCDVKFFENELASSKSIEKQEL